VPVARRDPGAAGIHRIYRGRFSCLDGGASDALRLNSAQEPGVIIAERSQFQALIATAQRIAAQADARIFFDKTNHLFDENSASVTASVKMFKNSPTRLPQFRWHQGFDHKA